MRQPTKWIEDRTRRLSGEWIRWRRLFRGMTQLEVSERVGCSHVYISDIENLRRSASPRISVLINEVLS